MTTALVRHDSHIRGIIVRPIDSGRIWTPTEFRNWLSGQTKGLRNSRIEFMPNAETHSLDLVILCDVATDGESPHGEVLVPHRFAPLGIMGKLNAPGVDFDLSHCVCGKGKAHPVHTFVS